MVEIIASETGFSFRPPESDPTKTTWQTADPYWTDPGYIEKEMHCEE